MVRTESFFGSGRIVSRFFPEARLVRTVLLALSLCFPAAADAQDSGLSPGMAPSQASAGTAASSPDEPAVTLQPAAPADSAPLRDVLPRDLSLWGMFMGADALVKGVIAGLFLASLASWTICLAKALEMAMARRQIRRALAVVREARTLDDAVRGMKGARGPAARMTRAVAEEALLSEGVLDHAGGSGVKERVSSVLLRIDASAARRMARGTGILATIGSTAPFVGLFGTVWGIMNSFIGISKVQTTNLAVVAPGIAEALLATAVGLIAAIPAVVIYNVFARSVTGYRRLLGDVASALERLLSRELDFRGAGRGRGEREPGCPPLHVVSEER